MKLILASASPRRKELVKQLNFVEPEFVASDFDEKSVVSMMPEIYAASVAAGKAYNVFKQRKIPTLGVDTVVVVDNRILGKPDSEDEAKRMLRTLSGRTHIVISGFCLISYDKTIIDCEKTKITFDRFDDEFIEKYIRSGSCFDKAGAYGIQDEMIKSVTLKIDGDYNNVVGLPLERLKKILLEK